MNIDIREETDLDYLNNTYRVLLVYLDDIDCIEYLLVVNILSAGGYLYCVF